MRSRPVISVQVVSEFLSVLLRQDRLPRETVIRLARVLMNRCEVMSVTRQTVETAFRIGNRYQVSHWDSLILAAALAAGCDTLFSEDLQHGQVFDGQLTVINPFL
jgi:predicted nucleic acid-binding protein